MTSLLHLCPGPALPEVHGHRGCRGLRPENTLTGFLYALSLGVDVIEMDVVVSADKQVVVSHEPWLNPSICLDPNGRPIGSGAAHDFNLYQMPYAEISRCDCGTLQHSGFPAQLTAPGYKPLLKEVLTTLELAARHLNCKLVGYSIEIKSSPEEDGVFHPAPPEFLRLVVAVLEAAQVLSRTTILCFDARVLRLVRQQFPQLATCLLVEAGLPWQASIRDLGFIPNTFGPDFSSVTEAAVRSLRESFPKLRLVPWTVNEPYDMRLLLGLGVDGLTTDYPDRLLAVLASR